MGILQGRAGIDFPVCFDPERHKSRLPKNKPLPHLLKLQYAMRRKKSPLAYSFLKALQLI